MTCDQILKELKNKVYRPVYLLHGEESYYIDTISDFIENNVLSESEKEFNQTILYGKDIDMVTLLSVVKRYPMMSNYQVVIVKEAQNLKGLTTKDDDDDEVSKRNLFAEYLQQPQTTTILVLCYKHKKFDGRSKSIKLAEKAGIVFKSEPLYDSKVADWIANHIASKKLKIQSKALQMLADYLGNDLSKIVNEIDKLLLNLKEGDEISVSLVQENIGISKDYNVFELNSSLLERNILKANRIVNYFEANPKANPMVLSLANIYSSFSKVLLYHTLSDKSEKTVAGALGINSYFVKDYAYGAKNYSLPKVMDVIDYLHQYDLKSKGVNNSGNVSDGQLLRELVFKILH